MYCIAYVEIKQQLWSKRSFLKLHYIMKLNYQMVKGSGAVILEITCNHTNSPRAAMILGEERGMIDPAVG
jgi:hypothetical protein